MTNFSVHQDNESSYTSSFVISGFPPLYLVSHQINRVELLLLSGQIMRHPGRRNGTRTGSERVNYRCRRNVPFRRTWDATRFSCLNVSNWAKGVSIILRLHHNLGSVYLNPWLYHSSTNLSSTHNRVCFPFLIKNSLIKEFIWFVERVMDWKCYPPVCMSVRLTVIEYLRCLFKSRFDTCHPDLSNQGLRLFP